MPLSGACPVIFDSFLYSGDVAAIMSELYHSCVAARQCSGISSESEAGLSVGTSVALAPECSLTFPCTCVSLNGTKSQWFQRIRGINNWNMNLDLFSRSCLSLVFCTILVNRRVAGSTPLMANTPNLLKSFLEKTQTTVYLPSSFPAVPRCSNISIKPKCVVFKLFAVIFIHNWRMALSLREKKVATIKVLIFLMNYILIYYF